MKRSRQEAAKRAEASAVARATKAAQAAEAAEAARAVEAFGVEPVEAEVSSSQSIAEGKGEEGTSGDAEGEATPDAEDPDAETDPKEENEGTDDDQNASTNRSSGAPDLHWRLTGSKADALIVAWRGCNRAALRGATRRNRRGCRGTSCEVSTESGASERCGSRE